MSPTPTPTGTGAKPAAATGPGTATSPGNSSGAGESADNADCEAPAARPLPPVVCEDPGEARALDGKYCVANELLAGTGTEVGTAGLRVSAHRINLHFRVQNLLLSYKKSID